MAYEPLTDDVLKEMHSRLRRDFKQISRFAPSTMPDISANVSAMANAISAMIAIEHEISNQQKNEAAPPAGKDNNRLKL
jgi:hypothetical protein